MFSAFLILIIVVIHRDSVLKFEYSQIEKEGQTTFSVLKEHHIKYKNGKRQDIYTYEIPDEVGEMHEVSESVDANTHNRLRVGDTVVCLRKIITLSRKKLVISRIKGNTEPPMDYTFLKNYAFFGLGFSIMLIVNSFFFWKV
ncbi:MAG: hypothetical protein KDK36_11945 [Leptospiraceae bacterium]|nr:hypothetical protein [Leptospiraceae bacterium]